MNPEHYRLLEEARRSIPDGYKVELSGEIIVMQASPSSIHQLNLALVQRQFEAHCPPGYFPTGNSDLSSPGAGAVRNPDLTYLPEDVVDLSGHEIPAELALIAVEVVSPSNPENDWTGKVRDYPRMGFPLYLIIDPRQKTVTLFSEPNRDRYHTRTEREFGETIRIPEPFGFELDLARLVPYRD
ncbi:Uma2 family endonuclease [Kitasatospora sp. NPDC001309]|uniref:Uma2 family endonuclease n=1 Tax=Kitasatospora sp. NPDC001309 TaxID=3364013 RepID=UPI0036CEA059